MHYTVKETYFLPDYSTENDYAILELVKDAGDDLGYLGLSWDSHNLMGNKQFDTFEYSIRFKEFCRKKIKYEVKEHEGKGK